MSDSSDSDKQLTVGDCGRLLPPNLMYSYRYCAESVIVLIKKYVIQFQISDITCKFSCCGLLKNLKFHSLSQNNLTYKYKIEIGYYIYCKQDVLLCVKHSKI